MGQQNYYVASSAKVLSSAFCQNALLANRQNAVKNLTGYQMIIIIIIIIIGLQIFRYLDFIQSICASQNFLHT